MNEELTNIFRGMTLVGKAALVVVVLALVVTLWSSVGVVGALLRPALDALGVPEPAPDLAARFASNLEADGEFINQKSIFFTPKAPVAPPKPGKVIRPTRSNRYGGPKLMGLSGYFAYFDRAVLDGAREIKIGQAGGVVELLRIVPPFKAVVKWQGQEWTLDLLQTEAIYAANGLGSGDARRFGTTERSRSVPFTTGGSSPNAEALFEGASTEIVAPAARRPTRGGSVRDN